MSASTSPIQSPRSARLIRRFAKATAIVNGDVITNTDVDQRLALVVLANGGRVSDKERDRLRVQVLRNLIDESLQIQEAKANEIKISKAEIEQSFARVGANFKRTPETFSKYLRENGSSDRTMKRQIEGELAWSRLLRRRVEPFVNVSDERSEADFGSPSRPQGHAEFASAKFTCRPRPKFAGRVQQRPTHHRADPSGRIIPGLCPPVLRSIDRRCRR